jgi:uncharacterized protein
MSDPPVQGVEFSVHDGRLCLAKLAPSVDPATLTHTPGFFSVTCTGEELSIVAEEQFAHPDAEIQRGWRAIKVKGPLEFELKGILASLLNPLNDAGISVFALSTYTTDYIFVLDYQLDRAVAALESAGHRLI